MRSQRPNILRRFERPMTPSQLHLFDAGPAMPDGFIYQPDALSPDDEATLVHHVRELPFKEFEFQGYLGKRRVVSFGWRYDYDKKAIEQAAEIPAFLLPTRESAAHVAGMAPDQLQQALVTEYAAGAAIGWHRDKAVYGEVIGVSLLSPATFRLRRKVGDKWERRSLTVEPRSIYVMRGPSRTEWEHSIPGVDALRYSITFRNLKR
jgi:alkylated DNA repair dioxygenase AlkB